MSRVAAICAALLVATQAAAAPSEQPVSALALVIGNNAAPLGDAGKTLAALRYADDDAVRYAEFFEQFTVKTVLLAVLDRQTQARYPQRARQSQPPTRAALRRTLRQFASEAKRLRAAGQRVVFYFAYSGHGARDRQGRAFLALHDGRLTREQLYRRVLALIPADVAHVFVDACYAASIVGARKLFDRETSARTVALSGVERRALLDAASLARLPHVGAIVATTGTQEAHEWSQIESGVFTHELLSGLRGAADVNADGVIEYSEVQAFIAAANRQVADPRAKSRVVAHPPAIDQRAPVIRLDTLRQARRLRGKLATLGRFFIERDNGQRLIEAHLNGPYQSTLVLPATGTLFLRTPKREYVIASAAALIDFDALVGRARSSDSRGAIDYALHGALFAAPFGPAYYQGHVDSVGGASVAFPPEAKPPASRPTAARQPVAPSTDGAADWAIFPFVVSGLEPSVGQVFRRLLGSEISTQFKHKVTQIQGAPCATERCAVADRRPAERLLFGRIDRLGKKLIVAVVARLSSGPPRQLRATVDTVDDLEEIAQRIVVALRTNKPLESTAELGTITAYETRKPRRRQGSLGALLRFGVFVPLGSGYAGPAGVGAGVDLALGYEAQRFAIESRVGFRSDAVSGADKYRSVPIDVGASWFLSRGPVSPFVGAGVGLRLAWEQRENRTVVGSVLPSYSSSVLDDFAVGFGGYGRLGVMFFRTWTAHLLVVIDYDAMYASLNGRRFHQGLSASLGVGF
ncbi:MAG: caspase family protein [Deltaproteobacteria bacterium]|nr:caspase family protein [Deltaproteobacteria bacterium]